MDHASGQDHSIREVGLLHALRLRRWFCERRRKDTDARCDSWASRSRAGFVLVRLLFWWRVSLQAVSDLLPDCLHPLPAWSGDSLGRCSRFGLVSTLDRFDRFPENTDRLAALADPDLECLELARLDHSPDRLLVTVPPSCQRCNRVTRHCCLARDSRLTVGFGTDSTAFLGLQNQKPNLAMRFSRIKSDPCFGRLTSFSLDFYAFRLRAHDPLADVLADLFDPVVADRFTIDAAHRAVPVPHDVIHYDL